LSPFLYLTAILSAYLSPWISGFFFVLVAAVWFVPDKRIERAMRGVGEGSTTKESAAPLRGAAAANSPLASEEAQEGA
jgi:hypothetical protein